MKLSIFLIEMAQNCETKSWILPPKYPAKASANMTIFLAK